MFMGSSPAFPPPSPPRNIAKPTHFICTTFVLSASPPAFTRMK
jgi:hypothetical protein